MKECPVCHAVVDEKYECPICGESLTYVEEAYGESRERLCRNRYTARYLLRELWFPVTAILICILAICVRWPLAPLTEEVTYLMPSGVSVQTTRQGSQEQYLWVALMLAMLSLIAALLRRKSTRWMQWKYSEDYAAWHAAAAKYELGIPAIVLALFLMLFAK